MRLGLWTCAAEAASSVHQLSWWRIVCIPAGAREDGWERFGAIRMLHALAGLPASSDRLSASFR